MNMNKKKLKIGKDDLSYEQSIDQVCFTDYVEPTGNTIYRKKSFSGLKFNPTVTAEEANTLNEYNNFKKCIHN